jgi:hypothetical protein
MEAPDADWQECAATNLLISLKIISLNVTFNYAESEVALFFPI